MSVSPHLEPASPPGAAPLRATPESARASAASALENEDAKAAAKANAKAKHLAQVEANASAKAKEAEAKEKELLETKAKIVETEIMEKTHREPHSQSEPLDVRYCALTPIAPGNSSDCSFENWTWDAKAAPSARTFTSACVQPRNRTELCAAFAARGIRKILFYGDSTMTNLFEASIYDLLPRAGPRDDTPGQPSSRPLIESRPARPGDCLRCNYCAGGRYNVKRTDGRSTPYLYPARQLEKSPCAHARRCDGALELEIWRGATQENGQVQLLNASLLQLSARNAMELPDAVVFSVGTHYMGTRPSLMRYAADLDVYTRLFLALPRLRGAVFLAQLGSTARKPHEFRLMQSSCEIGKLNAQAFELMAGFGVPVVDSLALSRRIGDAHSYDGTHWDAFTLAAQGSIAFQALLAAERQPPPRASPRPGGARASVTCALKIHRVTLVKNCPKPGGAWAAPTEQEEYMTKKLRDFRVLWE